jgi:hypothetical protein
LFAIARDGLRETFAVAATHATLTLVAADIVVDE